MQEELQNKITNDETPGVLKAAWLIALVTIASKLIGFVRDMVVANYYGATLVSDAYFYALQIPSLAIIILGGVGGPFHSAVVAVFSKLLGKECVVDAKINRLYNTFLTLTFLFFAALSVVGFLFADKIMGIIISAGSPELLHLASEHFKIMSPIILIGGIIGIFYGILVCHKKYIIPNISPMMLSLVVIAGIVAAGHFHTDSSGKILALATLLGAVVQILVQYPSVRKIGYRIKPNLNFVNNPHFNNIMELLFPAILSSTIGQIGIYIDMFFASTLKEGAWTSVVFANRIFQFPVGILVTAFLVPLFPIFSRLAGEGDENSIRNYFNKGVGVLFFAAIPIVILILLLAEDGISLVFERGAFDSNAVIMVSEALCFLSFSIIPYVFRDSITRVYYAYNDSKTPFLIAVSAIALKVVLNWFLILKLNMGIAGITLSTSLVTLYNATMLGLFMHNKIELNYKILFINLVKMLFAGFLTLLAGWYICLGFDKILLPKYIFEITKIFSVMLITLAMYTVLNLIFKMDYAGELLKRLKKH